MCIKVGDFGLAVRLEMAEEKLKTMCGTPNYIAPEVIIGDKESHVYSIEVDIWAIGAILYAGFGSKASIWGMWHQVNVHMHHCKWAQCSSLHKHFTTSTGSGSHCIYVAFSAQRLVSFVSISLIIESLSSFCSPLIASSLYCNTWRGQTEPVLQNWFAGSFTSSTQKMKLEETRSEMTVTFRCLWRAAWRGVASWYCEESCAVSRHGVGGHAPLSQLSRRHFCVGSRVWHKCNQHYGSVCKRKVVCAGIASRVDVSQCMKMDLAFIAFINTKPHVSLSMTLLSIIKHNIHNACHSTYLHYVQMSELGNIAHAQTNKQTKITHLWWQMNIRMITNVRRSVMNHVWTLKSSILVRCYLNTYLKWAS